MILCKETTNKINFEEIMKSDDMPCQFILDPTSLNLPVRVSLRDPILTELPTLMPNPSPAWLVLNSH